MAGIDDRVKEFLTTRGKRRTGELPEVDLRITCESCGVRVTLEESDGDKAKESQ
jgi:hypothetical protein